MSEALEGAPETEDIGKVREAESEPACPIQIGSLVDSESAWL